MTPINSEDKPTNSDYVALWQLQDIEETIQDASPEEMPELYGKLEALASGLTEAIQKLITTDRKRVALEARIDELEDLSPDMYYFGDIVKIDNRIAELKAKQEEV